MSFIVIGGGAFIGTSIAGNIQQLVPAFTPADLGPKLTLWLDERGQTVVGSDITNWNDQQTSTGPHNMVPRIGFGKPQTGSTINGYTAPQFVRAAPTLMDLTSPYKLQALIANNSYHVFSVANISDIVQNNPSGVSNEGIIYSAVAYWYPMSFKNNGGSPQMTVGHRSTAPAFETLTVSGLPLSTNVLLETWYDGTNLNCCIANGSVATQASLPMNNLDLPYGEVSIGIGSQAMNGNVGTILVCNQALDGTERANVRQYLGNKYGVSY